MATKAQKKRIVTSQLPFDDQGKVVADYSGKCYECRHKIIYMEDAHKYRWKCPDGKLRPVINDGRLTQ